jgi:hypothetical protein
MMEHGKIVGVTGAITMAQHLLARIKRAILVDVAGIVGRHAVGDMRQENG